MKPQRLPAFLALAVTGGFAIMLGACISENNYAERYAEVTCDKQHECVKKAGGDPGSKSDCINEFESIFEAVIDECDDYSGTLAHKCLKEAEDAGCNSSKIPDPCKEFNDKCGFENYQGGYDLGLGATPASIAEADL